jgi:hypothetical protein
MQGVLAEMFNLTEKGFFGFQLDHGTVKYKNVENTVLNLPVIQYMGFS